ncbi:MAG: (2Fe-2S) ferredoxin domain-containing protein [Sphingomonadales bacterium]|nr:(2Fe-2S) ferredoxin domain-containing protein [Sphingomonadales bacterium]
MQGGKATYQALAKRATLRGDIVKVNASVCMGYCAKGPNVKILGGDFFHRVTDKDLDHILDAAEALAD